MLSFLNFFPSWFKGWRNQQNSAANIKNFHPNSVIRNLQFRNLPVVWTEEASKINGHDYFKWICIIKTKRFMHFLRVLKLKFSRPKSDVVNKMAG